MFHKDQEKFSFDYESGASASHLVLSMDAGLELINCQIEMIANNPSEGILPVEIRRVNDKVRLYYPVTSKTTLADFLKRQKTGTAAFTGLIRGIIKVVSESGRYFLNESSFIMDGDYIFINPATGGVSLTYVPLKTAADINGCFKAFISELIVNVVNLEEASDGGILQKTLGYLRQDDFNLAGFDRFLSELERDIRPAQQPKQAAGANGRNEAEAPRKKAEAGPPVKEKKLAGRANKRNHMLIAVLAQALILIIIGIVIQILPTLDKDDRIATAGGIAMILGAGDFLLLRKLSGKRGVKNKRTGLSKREICNKALEDYRQSHEERYSGVPVDTPAALYPDETGISGAADCLDTVMLEDGAGPRQPAYLKSARDDVVEKIILNKPSFLIGRLEDRVDYVSRNEAVGKIHAELISRDGKYFVRDLNSKNGTRINGERVKSNIEHEVRNNDRVVFANSEYIFIYE